MGSPLPGRGDLFRVIWHKWSKIIGWGITWNQHIWDRDVGQNLLRRREKHLRAWKHLQSGREKVSQHLLVLSSGKPGCAGPLRNQKKSEISCLGEESISVYHRVTHQAAGNTCMTPVRGCKVLSRFYLLQETALEFRSRSTVPPALSAIRKENCCKYFPPPTYQQADSDIYTGLPAHTALHSIHHKASSLPARA